MKQTNLKPKKTPFLVIAGYKAILAGVILSVIIYVLQSYAEPIINLQYLLIAFLTFIALYKNSEYKQEKYNITKEQITVNTGSMFKNKEINIHAKNIIQLKTQENWIEKKLFNTGSLTIKSAGSSQDEIVLRHIKQYDEIKKLLTKHLQSQGFNLSMNKILQKKKPNPFGVFLEIMGEYIIALIAIYFTIGSILIELSRNSPSSQGPLLFGFIFISLILFVRAVINFLNKQYKQYILFTDTVQIKGGFLTKENSIMPLENFSDVSSEQNIFYRVFNIYNIKFSTKGQGNHINFNHVNEGEQFLINLKDRIKKISNTALKDQNLGQTTSNLNYSKNYKAKTFGIDVTRNILNCLVTISLLLTLLMTIHFSGLYSMNTITLQTLTIIIVTANTIPPLVKAQFTKYEIDEDGVKITYHFLSKTSQKFSYDKITYALINENIFDRLVGTKNIKLYSVGSEHSLKLRYIREKNIVNKIKNALYEESSNLKDQNNANKKMTNALVQQFNPLKYFASKPLLTMLTLLSLYPLIYYLQKEYDTLILANITTILLLGALLIWAYLQAVYKKASITLDDKQIIHNIGIINQKTKYMKQENIKFIESQRYFQSKFGEVTLHAAGGQQLEGNNQATIGAALQIKYIKHPFDMHDQFDKMLLTMPRGNKDKQNTKKHQNIDIQNLNASPFSQLYQTRPSAKNKIISISSLLILLFPLIWLLPFALIITPIYMRKISYHVDKHRIRTQKKLLIKYKKTLLNAKIDHTSVKKNILNKILGNASILLYTEASPIADMQLKDSKNYHKTYTIIKKQKN